MTLAQLYAAALQHVLSRNNPTSPADVENILLAYIAENPGGSVEGQAINPSSIGATTPTDSIATEEVSVYGTFTSNVIFERLRGYYDGTPGVTAFVIGTEKGASGGSARPLWVRIDGTDRLKFNTDGSANYAGSFSASSTISATIISAGYYVKSTPRIFSDLDVAATAGEGARAFITDSNLSYNSLNIGSAVAGGGANSTPVIVIGGAWVVG